MHCILWKSRDDVYSYYWVYWQDHLIFFDGVFCLLLPFPLVHVTRGHWPWSRVTMKNLDIKVAFLLGKSVGQGQRSKVKVTRSKVFQLVFQWNVFWEVYWVISWKECNDMGCFQGVCVFFCNWLHSFAKTFCLQKHIYPRNNHSQNILSITVLQFQLKMNVAWFWEPFA